MSFDDKFALIKEHGTELFTMIDSKLQPVIQNVFFLYDQATNTITSYINVITDKHARITEYVNTTYGPARVAIEGTWMRMDIDKDGSVSIEDLKQSMASFYSFLKDFDVIEATTQFKTKLYTEAIQFMQSELEQEKLQKNQREV